MKTKIINALSIIVAIAALAVAINTLGQVYPDLYGPYKFFGSIVIFLYIVIRMIYSQNRSKRKG